MIQSVKNKGKLKVLADEDVDGIHEATLKILERTGLRIDSVPAQDRLLKNGAIRHPTRKNVITFPRNMVEESIDNIPRYGRANARDPKNDVVYDGETTIAHCEGGNPNFMDFESGRIRMATYNDLAQSCKLMDTLDYCATIGNIVVATDAPAPILSIKTMEATIKNSSKATSGYALKTEEVDAIAKMGAVLSGGMEEQRKRPLLSIYGSPSSPLTYDSHVCDIMIRGAEYGLPVDIVPCPIVGGTSPMTLAGGLAQQNAELLGGVMIIQTVSTKLPIMYCGRLSMMDQRSGRDIWGIPEMAIVSAATVQIAHRYHMTADVYGVTTDVNSWDFQTGLERMQAAMVPALAGADSLSGMGGMWENACSLEMLVIDDEIYADVFRAIRGFEVDDEHLALDIIDKVGPMGNFLSQPHTMKHLRAGEIRTSPLFDKRSVDKMNKEGGFRPLHEAAKERARKLMKDHVVLPLDKGVERELDRVIKEESKKLMAKG